MNYPVVNLRRTLGQGEPARYVPVGPPDCTNIAEYQKGLDNAAQRIAYYQQQMQAAVPTGNEASINAASSGATLANSDWNAWSTAINACKQAPASTIESSSTSLVLGIGTIVLVGVLATTAFMVPKLFGLK